MLRALRPTIRAPEKGEFASPFPYAGAAIPIFSPPDLFSGPHTSFAVVDDWRSWIIRLWLEGSFELFATALVALTFHQLRLISTKMATLRWSKMRSRIVAHLESFGALPRAQGS